MMLDDSEKNEKEGNQIVLSAQANGKSKRQIHENEEDKTPLWIKFFGGSILSMGFLSVITLTGYLVSNLNSLQTQINLINSESVTKRDFNERYKSLWDAQTVSDKNNNDNIQNAKERLNSLESSLKERQATLEKYETLIKDVQKNVEAANKEIAGFKERLNLYDMQLNAMRDENKQLQKDLQTLRERTAALEAASKKQ